MNSALDVMKRWQAMDAALGDTLEGLVIKRFAKKWRVSERTIRRDIEVFRALGQEIVWQQDERGRYTNSLIYSQDRYSDYLFVASTRGEVL